MHFQINGMIIYIHNEEFIVFFLWDHPFMEIIILECMIIKKNPNIIFNNKNKRKIWNLDYQKIASQRSQMLVTQAFRNWRCLWSKKVNKGITHESWSTKVYTH